MELEILPGSIFLSFCDMLNLCYVYKIYLDYSKKISIEHKKKETENSLFCILNYYSFLSSSKTASPTA